MPARDPLAEAIADLARTAQGLEDGAEGDRADPLAGIRHALDVRRQADLVLAAAVDAARAAGCTWQQVGDVLGTSRQAAFQRFGHPVDPRTGKTMDRTTLAGADARALEFFTAMAERRWEDAGRDFDPKMAEALPTAKLADAWATVVGTVGAYERAGEPFVRRQGDYTVVDLPLAFEAGEMTGRIAFDAHGRVSGMFVLDPEHAGGSR
jgi:Protein of unknown function (DUF3887)